MMNHPEHKDVCWDCKHYNGDCAGLALKTTPACKDFVSRYAKGKWISHYECSICGEIVRTKRAECPFCKNTMEE